MKTVENSIAIVIPTLNNFTGLFELINSVDTKVKYYLIDNFNKGWSVAKSWNYGLDLAIKDGHDHILISNDDVVYSPGAVAHLSRWLYNNPEYDMVTPNNSNEPVWHKVDESPDFSAFMVTKAYRDKVGTFDENFQPAYFEDNDAHRRQLLLGVKSAKICWVTIEHRGSQTQNSVENGIVTSPMFEENRSYFGAKWGGFPGDEKFDHPYNDPKLSPRDWVKFR